MYHNDTDDDKPANRSTAPALTRREEAVRRVLNLLFSLSVAIEPLTTDQIINDPEIGYASPSRDSRIKAFNRDRETLSSHGLFIREAENDGGAKNEQRTWKIDRSLSFVGRKSISAQDAEDAVGAIDRMFALHADDPSRWPLQTARTKLCEVAGLDPDAPHGGIGVDAETEAQNASAKTKRELTFVWNAFSRRKPVSFAYRDVYGNEKPHDLDVYGVFEQGSYVYLVGFDHDAQALRTFRTDRITSVKPSPDSVKSYAIPPEFEVSGFHFLPFDFGSGKHVQARFSFPGNLGRHEIEFVTKGRGELEKTPEGVWLWNIDIRDIDNAARFTLEHASLGLRALEPSSLIESISLRKRQAVMAHGGR